MPELADILIWLGIIGAIIISIWQYFLSRKKTEPRQSVYWRGSWLCQ
jgi:hypothetical protein